MAMRDYEDMKDIVIPKEQEEMMNIICDAWDECCSLETCKECKDRPKKFMRMAMCTALKYTRKLIEAGYAKQPTTDVVKVVRCKDCIYFQPEFVLTNDGERRPYTEQEIKNGKVVSMDREKQVEEIDELTTVLYEANHKKSVLDYRWLATEAYNAGYRKARKNHTGTDEVLRSIDYRPVEEVRKETAKEILQILQGYDEEDYLQELEIIIAKKYGVEVEE